MTCKLITQFDGYVKMNDMNEMIFHYILVDYVVWFIQGSQNGVNIPFNSSFHIPHSPYCLYNLMNYLVYVLPDLDILGDFLFLGY